MRWWQNRNEGKGEIRNVNSHYVFHHKIVFIYFVFNSLYDKKKKFSTIIREHKQRNREKNIIRENTHSMMPEGFKNDLFLYPLCCTHTLNNESKGPTWPSGHHQLLLFLQTHTHRHNPWDMRKQTIQRLRKLHTILSSFSTMQSNATMHLMFYTDHEVYNVGNRGIQTHNRGFTFRVHNAECTCAQCADLKVYVWKMKWMQTVHHMKECS